MSFLKLNTLVCGGGYEYAMRSSILRKAWECFLQHFLRLRREFSADLRESSPVRGCLKWQASGRGGGTVVLQQHSSSLRGVNAVSQLSKESNSNFNEGHREELFTEKIFPHKQPQRLRKETFYKCKYKDLRLKLTYKSSRSSTITICISHWLWLFFVFSCLFFNICS